MFTQQWALLEESLTRKFDTPLWFLTLGNSTEFQVTVNLSKPFPICPSLLLCLLFAHLKDCVLCKCVCACACVRACTCMCVCTSGKKKQMQQDEKIAIGNMLTFYFTEVIFSLFPSKFRKALQVMPVDTTVWKLFSYFHFSLSLSHIYFLGQHQCMQFAVCELLLNLHVPSYRSVVQMVIVW